MGEERELQSFNEALTAGEPPYKHWEP
jgi:hypothetical protein